jgi:hypothetical protein
MKHLDLQLTDGLIGGETIQFAEGRYPGVVGAGVAMREEAFDLVEPIIRAACPNWTSGHRYGVFQLSTRDRKKLLHQLRAAAAESTISAVSNLYGRLADWIEPYCEHDEPIGIFGY